MTPKELAEIQMCDECISHLMENAGPDHIIVKYRAALIKLQEQAEEIIQANHRYADLQNICDDQDKEIKRLEDALVEERGKLFHQFGDAELDKPTESDCWFAREQLRDEGAIRESALSTIEKQIEELLEHDA